MRYVLGPTFPSEVASPPVKSDPTPDLLGVENGQARYRVPAYSLSDSNRLDEIRVYLIPDGISAFSDAAELVASAHPFSPVDVSTLQVGGTVAIPLPEVGPGAYLGQTVYGYQD